MQAKRGTYLITFEDGTQIVCGNNYKWWYVHATELAVSWERQNRMGLNEMFVAKVEKVEYSQTEFVDDGGLKYASPAAYQDIIETETKKDGVKRLAFKDLIFTASTTDRLKLTKSIESW